GSSSTRSAQKSRRTCRSMAFDRAAQRKPYGDGCPRGSYIRQRVGKQRTCDRRHRRRIDRGHSRAPGARIRTWRGVRARRVRAWASGRAVRRRTWPTRDDLIRRGLPCRQGVCGARTGSEGDQAMTRDDRGLVTEERFRPTWAEIDLSAVRGNARALVGLARAKGLNLFAVVKANAYGHGAIECARAALAGGATGLAVATVEEGIGLRRGGL